MELSASSKAMRNGVIAANVTSVGLAVVGCVAGWSLLKGIVLITGATVGVAVVAGTVTGLVEVSKNKGEAHA